MSERMWPLDAFRFDEDIPGDEVYVLVEEVGGLALFAKD